MHDVIIVGGGVAGCYAASLLPKRLDILVLEKDKKVLPKDSGIVSCHFGEFFCDERLIKRKENRMECISPGGKKFLLKSEEPFAYILRREMFSKRLRKAARRRAEIRFEAVTAVRSGKDSVKIETNKGEYTARMALGCDGANSLVRRSMGIRPPSYSVGIMAKTKEKMDGNIKVFFNKYYSPDYFAWMIPGSREYGIITALRPREYLRFFAMKQNLPSGKMTAHIIPMGMTRSFANRILLVGDACGQNKPLTGGGIIFSMKGAQAAASMVKDAMEMKNFSPAFLSNYERIWKAEMGKEIRRQMFARKVYRRLTNREIDTLFDKFGGAIQAAESFDYDRLSLLWKHLPLWEKTKFAALNLRYAF